jgi:hypothetical protein
MPVVPVVQVVALPGTVGSGLTRMRAAVALAGAWICWHGLAAPCGNLGQALAVAWTLSGVDWMVVGT